VFSSQSSHASKTHPLRHAHGLRPQATLPGWRRFVVRIKSVCRVGFRPLGDLPWRSVWQDAVNAECPHPVGGQPQLLIFACGPTDMTVDTEFSSLRTDRMLRASGRRSCRSAVLSSRRVQDLYLRLCPGSAIPGHRSAIVPLGTRTSLGRPAIDGLADLSPSSSNSKFAVRAT